MVLDFFIIHRSYLDPLFCSPAICMDHSVQSCIQIHWIIEANGFDLFEHKQYKFICSAALNVGPLDRCISLALLASGTKHSNIGIFLKFCILSDIQDDQQIPAVDFKVLRVYCWPLAQSFCP